jgi:hypothetical protein
MSAGAQPEQIAFATDDELGRRLQQVENGLRHLEAMIPSLAREVAAIRHELAPAAG